MDPNRNSGQTNSRAFAGADDSSPMWASTADPETVIKREASEQIDSYLKACWSQTTMDREATRTPNNNSQSLSCVGIKREPNHAWLDQCQDASDYHDSSTSSREVAASFGPQDPYQQASCIQHVWPQDNDVNSGSFTPDAGRSLTVLPYQWSRSSAEHEGAIETTTAMTIPASAQDYRTFHFATNSQEPHRPNTSGAFLPAYTHGQATPASLGTGVAYDYITNSYYSSSSSGEQNYLSSLSSAATAAFPNTDPMFALNRSTKGASKQRRDLINAEITNLRDLLPLPETARQRLSQLQIMSLGCVYIRKSNYFSRLFGSSTFSSESPFEFSQTMTGFLLITTREGKLLYISENVTEYLGHSMVDMMTQGDSIYDIVDKKDHSTVQSQLLQSPAPSESGDPSAAPVPGVSAATDGSKNERTFFCRMNVARSFRRQAGFGDHKTMHVRGQFVQPVIRDHYGNQPVFMAMCTPLITPDVKEAGVQNNTLVFHTVHGLDMSLIEMGHTGEHHLGFTEAEMYGKSWYSMLHPNDIHEAREKHIQLIKSSHEMGCMLTVRLQTKYGEWVWVNTVMHIRQPFVCDNGDPAIVCINQVIRDGEAEVYKLQSQLYSSHIARSPEFMGPSQRGSSPHTITQVPVDRQLQASPYMSGMPSSQASGSDEGSVYYQGHFITGPITGAGAQHVESPERSHTPVPTTFRASGGSSDSGSEFSGCSSGKDSPPDQKLVSTGAVDRRQIVRESLLNKIWNNKRQHSDLASSLQPQQQQQNAGCKPAKIPRMNTGDHGGQEHGNGSSTATYTASILTQPLYRSFGRAVGGEGQLLAPASDVPVYAQLVQNKDIQLLKPIEVNPLSPVVISSQALVPSGPLTPDSMTSDLGDATLSTSILTNLKVEIVDAPLIPPSILTPDNSPAPSPSETSPSSRLLSYVTNPALAEQMVPSTVEGEMCDLSLLEDPGSLLKQQHEAVLANMKKSLLTLPTATSQGPTPPSSTLLPILDTHTLEDYLTDLETKEVESLRRAILGGESPQPSCPSPVGSISSVSETGEGEAMMIQSPAQQPNPAAGGEQQSEQQLEKLVASVADAILDLVQQASEGNVNLNDLSGGFMIVPNNTGTIGSQSDARENESAGQMSADLGNPLPVDFDGDDFFLDEFHQLSNLASPVPSYGTVDVVGSVFEQTL